MIGALQADGTVRAVYCHADGYPAGVGATLAQRYSTGPRVAALLELGDLAGLGVVRALCVAYGRDSGEAGTDATIYPSPAEFWADAVGPDGVGEFAYLFCPTSGWWARSDRTPGTDAPLLLVLEQTAAAGA